MRNLYFCLNKLLRHRNLGTEQFLLVNKTTLFTRMVSSTGEQKTAMETTQNIATSLKVRENPALKKIDTPEFHGIFTPELKALIALFEKYKYEIRIAGGAVRDLLMQIPPKDIDLATTATPDQMKTMFTQEDVRMINAKGEKHGTITPRINNKENFEVTTLRIDVRTDGRHAEVQFTTDWQLDANRRDLTINSMFLGFDGTLYDYFFGYEDLQQRRVVFVGSADIRIKEDYLRILRYFRFYGRIAEERNKHDELTLKAMRDNCSGLAQVSGERIWTELQKIVIGNFGEELVMQMIDCGILSFCGFPEKPNVDEFRRFCSVIKDFETPHSPILYIISLLHTLEDVRKLHERLKFSAYERDFALFISQQRNNVDKNYVCLLDYQILCLQPYSNREFVEQLLKYCGKIELYHALKDWKAKFPLSGKILKEHGCREGIKMGLILNELKSVWISSDFKLTATELLENHLPSVLKNVSTITPPSTPKKRRKSQE